MLTSQADVSPPHIAMNIQLPVFVNVRFGPRIFLNADCGNPAESIDSGQSETMLRFGGTSPMCGRLSFGKCKLKSYKAGRCGHVFDLLVRHE